MTTDDVRQPASSGVERSDGVVVDRTHTQVARSSPPGERKQQCYCCGHANPAAAFECEKCYVRL
jgi:hypothetical protein